MKNETLKILKSNEDFDLYKLALNRISYHRHYGDPEEFPCMVESEFSYNPNGADYYCHDFMYPITFRCECGKIHKIWPDGSNVE